MRKEFDGSGAIYRSYVIDDGWKVPKNVIEVIDLRIEVAKEDAIKRVMRARKNHKGDWLTRDAANLYEEAAWVYRCANGNQYTGEVKRLGDELISRFGVTEVEAFNILRGLHVGEYVNKYHLIKEGIPDYVDSQRICDDVLEEYGYAETEDYCWCYY